MSEVGSAAGLTFLFWVYRVCGRLPFRLALYPVVTWFYLRRGVSRRASLEFLGAALGRPARWREGLHHYLTFADAILDKLIAWNDGFTLEDCTFTGRGPFAELLATGRGCLLVSSHLGNVEICRVLARWRPELELHVLVHTQHAEKFNRVMKRVSQDSQVNLHQVTQLDAARAAWISERIERGAVVVIAGDRIPVGEGRVVEAPFFGRQARFAQGPYLLAHALGCPVFLLFCLRRARGFEVELVQFAERIRLPRGERREVEVAALAGRFARELEVRARAHPLQWFNFYPYWEAA
jgi:predicted LPLAT superfamily acyltransferase